MCFVRVRTKPINRTRNLVIIIRLSLPTSLLLPKPSASTADVNLSWLNQMEHVKSSWLSIWTEGDESILSHHRRNPRIIALHTVTRCPHRCRKHDRVVIWLFPPSKPSRKLARTIAPNARTRDSHRCPRHAQTFLRIQSNWQISSISQRGPHLYLSYFVLV